MGTFTLVSYRPPTAVLMLTVIFPNDGSMRGQLLLSPIIDIPVRLDARSLAGTYVLRSKCTGMDGGYVRTSKNRPKNERAICEQSLIRCCYDESEYNNPFVIS